MTAIGMSSVATDGWNKAVKVLHLSDLYFAVRSFANQELEWDHLLGLEKIEEGAKEAHFDTGAAAGERGFDYIVVAGNYLGADLAGQQAATALLRSRLKNLLKKSRPDQAEPESADFRILLVPGESDTGADTVATIWTRAEMTLVGVNYAAKASAPTREELARLQNQIEDGIGHVRGEAKEYIRSTPTLLVSSGALVLNDTTDRRITENLNSRLKELGVTLHLYGKNPIYCYSHNPFLHRFLSLGTGARPKSRAKSRGRAAETRASRGELPKIRANLISFEVSVASETAHEVPKLKQSVRVSSIEWNDPRWSGKPFLNYVTTEFLPMPEEPEHLRPVHAQTYAEIRTLLAGGKIRYIHVSGLPGSGRRAFFEDLVRSSQGIGGDDFNLKAVVVCKEVGYDQPEKQFGEIKAALEGARQNAPNRPVLLVLFDSGIRPVATRSDGVSESRDELLERIRLLLIHHSGLVVLHLLGRIEDRQDDFAPLGLYDSQIALLRLAMNDHEDGVGEVERRSERLAPLAVTRIRELCGRFPGFADTLIAGIVAHFRQGFASYRYREAAEVASLLVKQALEAKAAKILSDKFFDSLGPESKEPVLELLHQLLNDPEPKGVIRLKDVDEALQGRFRLSVEKAFDRFVEYNLLRRDPEDPDLFHISRGLPRVPTHHAPKRRRAPARPTVPEERQLDCCILYQGDHLLDLALRLKAQLEKALAGISFPVLPVHGTTASRGAEAERSAIEADLLILVHDRSFSEHGKGVRELALWWANREQRPAGSELVPIGYLRPGEGRFTEPRLASPNYVYVEGVQGKLDLALQKVVKAAKRILAARSK